jgi:hypothetical protein
MTNVNEAAQETRVKAPASRSETHSDFRDWPPNDHGVQ